MRHLWSWLLFGCHTVEPPATITSADETPSKRNIEKTSQTSRTIPSPPPIPNNTYFIGIPTALLTNITNPEKTHRLIETQYGDHGWKVSREGDNLTVRLDYRAIFDHRPEMSQWAQYISQHNDSGKRIRDYTHYVQQLQYTAPPFEENNTITGGYWTIATVLTKQAGDCDSLSMLLASLAAVEKVPIVLLHNAQEDIQHMVIGISIEPKEKELITEVNGQRYVIFDTTINHPPSQQQRNFLTSQAFDIIHLYP